MAIVAPAADPETRERQIRDLLGELTLDEKIFMLSGHGFLQQMKEDGGKYGARLYHVAAGNERLGIPALLFNDGPRGINMGRSTCFPVPMARGASFDVDLERRIGDAIGRELRAHGGNLFGGICINLLRHPAWGRAQETYGEDPFLLGEMGTSLARGVQHHDIVATAKHFAANSMENARFSVDVSLDERPLREVYLPHFKRCVDAGVGAVMSAYNKLNGTFCGHNESLLTGILKDDWGFQGFVYSDFILGCRGWNAFPAGLDVEAPDTIRFGPKLTLAVERGDVSQERIDDGVTRVLRSLFRTLAAPDPETYGPEVVACTAHRALAREAAQKSIVLLRNEQILPWDTSSLGSILVLGRLADEANLGDRGSSDVSPPEVITPLSGLRSACGMDCEVGFDSGDDLDRVRALAADAEAVLLVVGYDYRDEGEYIPGGHPGSDTGSIGGDRLDLSLGARQEALILAATEANPNTVVAVMAGSAVLMEHWREQVPAILLLWYPGMEGGNALADILFGQINPSGRLPFSMPRRAEDLPTFDRDASACTYDLWHGYTKLERDGVEPAFAFGFGLSYTEFGFANASVQLDAEAETLSVEVDVTNSGSRPGETVVQAYAGRTEPDIEQPMKRLCAFTRLALGPGETRRAELRVALKDIAWFDSDASCWRLGARLWTIRVGGSSANADLCEATIELLERRWSV
ncbi:MAG: glycoside hydrolase family 3 C-terminal domain-containing protein, partial [Deltaproteobacteria bacterium]|nr:glycoside hydrolase family 3 C-terminal domain-containing protein [Deltaproteobacteria bacterium]